ncbi:MAG TPA: DUF523 and DUF1722 domain-containing protein [Candidatus Tectomicrobia bacterium]|nr:DUF523 and DUF1722 domain-containing protein [Candidatus Tectomicrobia bacterium]
MSSDAPTITPVRLGISACLLGQKVRYDGGHKRDAFLVEVFGRYVEWVPVCPEVEMGLGVPRDALRLELQGDDIRLIMPETGTDYTEGMRAFAATRLAALASERLCGYIFKKDSPSCGTERVRLYPNHGVPRKAGQGVFAAALMQRFPHLPIEEEGRLNDPRLRENFVARVFAFQRWRQMAEQSISRAALLRFHAQHKFLLLAHSQVGTQRLGRLVAQPEASVDAQTLASAYLDGFTEVMRRTPTRRGHTNVLQHLAGYVSDHLDGDEREELTQMIEHYRRGLLPLIVPVTLIRHYVRKFRVAYLLDQVYLTPHPHELMLLNQL